MRRFIAAALLLYPRAVRHGHGEEIETLVTELIEREGHSRPRVISRLALDGLAQRLTSRATAWVLVVTLVLTTLGGLAVSDFAAASAHPPPPAVLHTTTPDAAKLARQATPAPGPRLAGARAHRTGAGSAEIIAP
jgi:hypothetical protein